MILSTFHVLITVLLLHTGASRNVTFGDCLPYSTNCSVCYHTLKESLLKRDDYVRKLSETFFPPRNNQPEFVEVTYLFSDNDSQVWYLTHDSPYLFFPIEIFQYMSLFFGKPASLFSQKVTLTLDEDCSGASHDIMLLLTQRVRTVY